VNHLNQPSPIKLQEHHYDDAPQSPACICMFVIMGAIALTYLQAVTQILHTWILIIPTLERVFVKMVWKT